MRQAYPSDLSDAQWELLEKFFAEAERGRPREVNIRDVVDAIYYVNRTGVQWRYLPHDFPRWDLVYSYFRKWDKDDTWDQVQRLLREGVRTQAQREPTPSMACVDSQSVKGTECGGTHGIDGNKKINGVKRNTVRLDFCLGNVANP
jgi:putative transposase